MLPYNAIQQKLQAREVNELHKVKEAHRVVVSYRIVSLLFRVEQSAINDGSSANQTTEKHILLQAHFFDFCFGLVFPFRLDARALARCDKFPFFQVSNPVVVGIVFISVLFTNAINRLNISKKNKHQKWISQKCSFFACFSIFNFVASNTHRLAGLRRGETLTAIEVEFCAYLLIVIVIL